jgi:heme exporter protein B
MTNYKEILSSSLKLTAKDLRVEFRRLYEFLSIVTFAVSSVLIVSFNWRGTTFPAGDVVSIVLWVITFFSCILILTTSFSREVDRGTIDGLRSLPLRVESILLGKFLYGFVLMLFIIAIVLPSSVIFMGVDPALVGSLSFTFIVGYLDLTLVGSMVSALLIYSEGKTLLLSFLLLPASIPVLISGTGMTLKVLEGMSILDLAPEIRLLVAYFLLVALVSVLLFPEVFSE